MYISYNCKIKYSITKLVNEINCRRPWPWITIAIKISLPQGLIASNKYKDDKYIYAGIGCEGKYDHIQSIRHANTKYCNYRHTSNIRRTIVGNKLLIAYTRYLTVLLHDKQTHRGQNNLQSKTKPRTGWEMIRTLRCLPASSTGNKNLLGDCEVEHWEIRQWRFMPIDMPWFLQ